MMPSSPQRPPTSCGFCGYADSQPFTFCPRCGRSTSAVLNTPTQSGGQNPGSQPTLGESFGSAPTQAGSRPLGAPTPYGLPPTNPAGAPPVGWYTGPNPQAGAYPNPQAPGWAYPGPTPQAPAGAYPGPTAPGAAYPGPTPQAAAYPGPAAPGGFYTQSGAYPGAPIAPLGAQTGQPPRQRWSGKKRLLVFGLPLVLVLALTVGVFAFVASLLAYNPAESAKFLPSNTLAYSSIDLLSVAQNGSKLSQSDVNNTTNTSGFEQATGLNFQDDVQPWLKRDFSVALVNIAHKADDVGSQPVFETVFLISTKDTSASNAAIRKVINAQQSLYGVKFTTITYGGVTLQSDVDSVQTLGGDFQNQPAAAPLVLGIVKDRVIIASTVAVAEQVIDSANGNAQTLADNASFKDAVSKMPKDRFITVYINVHALVHSTLAPGQDANLGTVDNYPVAFGYAQFTSDGLRVGFTLESKAGTHLKYNVSGDTTASAAAVPDTAFVYGSLGNLGGFYQQVQDVAGTSNVDNSFEQTFGLSLSDPLFQAPLSFALLPPSAQSESNSPDVLALLHVSGNVGQADAKIQQAFQHANLQTDTTSVDGVTVLQVQPGGDGSGPSGYYAALNHDLVFATSLDGITQAIEASQGKIGSLAKSAAYQHALSQQPKNNAASLFVNLDALANSSGALGDSFRSFLKTDHSIISKIKTSYLIYTWDDSGISLTETLTLK